MIAAKNGHGFDGKFDLKTRQVESPYRGKDGEKQTEVVPFNTRESNARRLNLGQAQSEAFEIFWRLKYQTGLFNQMAVDTTKDPVDGGWMPDPYSERKLEASKTLEHIRLGLGVDDYTLLEATCVNGLNFRETAQKMYGPQATHKQIEHTTWAVKVAYNRLAVHLGLSGRSKAIARLQSHMEADARPQDRPELRGEG